MMVKIFSINPPLTDESLLGSRGPLLHDLALLLKEKGSLSNFLNKRQIEIDMKWRLA